MRYDAVLFDFSGTLFGRASGHEWLFRKDGAGGVDERLRRTVVGALRSPEQYVASMSSQERDDWLHRDVSHERNRRAYQALFRIAGLRDEQVFAMIFDRLQDARYWLPYDDTSPVLNRLRRAGVPVGVLSNITWDIREAFVQEGLDSLVGSYVLSYEVGRCKPDPEIFQVACARLGVPPERCLLVGDDAVSDGGAVPAGLGFAQVVTGPVGVRPSVLLPALTAHGL
ncbi:HAD-IA family hydrolase [Streptomyces sp. NPDC048404]|uniref:HAD family hydrolase n=1 Tax=unclassified Streptomyces TaxID=2593676 RepID=UPI0034397789